MVDISTFTPLVSVVLLPLWTCGWRPFCFQLEYRTISLALVDDLRSYVMLKLWAGHRVRQWNDQKIQQGFIPFSLSWIKYFILKVVIPQQFPVILGPQNSSFRKNSSFIFILENEKKSTSLNARVAGIILPFRVPLQKKKESTTVYILRTKKSERPKQCSDPKIQQGFPPYYS